jgi:GLPGLI family protein
MDRFPRGKICPLISFDKSFVKMKSMNVFFLCLLCRSFIGWGSENKAFYEVKYEMIFQIDSTDVSLIQSEFILLWIGSEGSMSFPFLRFYNDSVYRSLDGVDRIRKNELASMSLKRPSLFNFYIYKNYKDKTIADDHWIFGSMYKYSESITDFKWQLHDEYEEYHGFRCQKATTYYGGRHWEVWFAAEIPISDGPYKFAGLPGLILKARDTRSHYVFELMHIRRAEPYKKIYEKNSRPFYVNRCQFLRALQHHNQNIGATVTAGTINIDPQKVKEIEERFKKQNNHIELKCD